MNYDNKPAGTPDGQDRPFRFGLSTALIIAVSLACTCISAVTWFREDETLKQLSSGEVYTAQVELLKDPDGLHGGDNLLWNASSLLYCNDEVPVNAGVQTGYAVISNLSTATVPMDYQLDILQISSDGTETVVGTYDGSSLEPGATARAYAVDFVPGKTLKVRLYTARENTDIYIVSTPQELTKAYPTDGVIYLTRDIVYPGTLVFEDTHPTVNLAGHTLQADGLSVVANDGVFGDMVFENGRLVIGGQAYTDGQTVTATGQGRINVTLRDMK